MVKKLFKHEILAYLRVWIPIQIVLLGISVLGRIIQFFESETTVYNTVFGSMVFVYIVTVIVTIGFTFFFAITRFYKNLFTGEGYLSFTLPVTTTQHIMTKLWTAMLFFVMSVISVIISFCIITAGDALTEIIKLLAYWFETQSLGSSILKINYLFYFAEIILTVLCSVMASFLLIYACISIGQSFNKSRVLSSIGIYFIYYFIKQIFGMIFIIIAAILEEHGIFAKLSVSIPHYPMSVVHILICGYALFTVILAVIYYYISKRFINKKLNLE